ncbi:hypothetical protein SELMODRAFT_409920 [Selaginella moellendorffii]|uniref:BZIP domain-containing protein n=1 Tax=Selaginella moellendorffii TaxID=88036 RepID=D8RCW1_SELML|nr:basic leucine zipper 19 [Selaginella moellendorffii]EFJ30209.1 hypothetical protein SELMODRAFT_409920 [Selaginella moellendorffii]|eukprot:XP_002969093.1 basic leucine zipper 19 [Selaginella moellendorffii]
MDDGEVDFSDHDIFCGASNLVCDDDHSAMESFLDEILKSTHTCTHTHTCNPPGPDKTHTHTCFHTHTQLFASPEEGSSHQKEEEDHHRPGSEALGPGSIATAATTATTAAAAPQSSKKRPLGNREAVRKYREKKKAHAAYLEEQVAQLKALNQQLVKRLQGQAALEAEVARLRALLSEFRGRIDAELGCFPFKRPCSTNGRGGGGGGGAAANGDECSPQLQALSGGFYLNSVSVPCDADVPCFHGDSTSSQPQLHGGKGAIACDYVSESCQGTLGDSEGGIQ